MISRQSKTLEQAVARYVQKNNRSPPPGFEEWFKFAQDHQSAIIDDYGQLDKDLEPLRKVPSNILRQRIKNATKAGMWLLYQWDFKDGNVTTTAKDDWETVRTYREIMTPFLDKLPEFTVLQSWDDSHRVCGPKDGKEDVLDASVFQAQCHGGNAVPSPRDHLLQGCPRNTASKALISSDRPSIDVCTNADAWKTRHGIFGMHNGCFNSTVPVLSLAKVSSFQDVLTASWCYGGSGYRALGDNQDKVAYVDKKPRMYWRGSNTGARYEKEFAFRGHRQRLVMLGHQLRAKAAQLAARVSIAGDTPDVFSEEDRKRVELPNMPKTFSKAQLSAISRFTNDTFDMNFVNLHGCDGDDSFCKDWKETIPLAEHQSSSYAFQNKFLMDLDGNSMSCRFYRLLDSNSLVFKQTIYVEWHDDRIVPWLHYIPVSTDLEELPILLDFFANDPRGEILGQKIAETSRQWASTGLRKIDLSIYTYRQMLELADIIGHD